MNLDDLIHISWEDADNNGWHDDYPAYNPKEDVFRPAGRELSSAEHAWIGNKLLLVVSEVIEAHDELRNGKLANEIYYDENGKPLGFLTELADVFVRLGDFLGVLGVTPEELEAAINLKLAYNRKRGYKHGHKRS